MTTAETLMVFLLLIISYLLFQIVKQLSYLTGVRIKLPFSNHQWTIRKQMYKKEKKSYAEPEKKEKLPN